MVEFQAANWKRTPASQRVGQQQRERCRSPMTNQTTQTHQEMLCPVIKVGERLIVNNPPTAWGEERMENGLLVEKRMPPLFPSEILVFLKSYFCNSISRLLSSIVTSPECSMMVLYQLYTPPVFTSQWFSENLNIWSIFLIKANFNILINGVLFHTWCWMCMK